MKSGLIRDIDITHEYNDTFFLTFDIDWASDEVLNDTIDLVEKYDVHSTWFVTHETPVLRRLRENPKFELGIHPNFNRLLLNNTESTEDMNSVIRKIKKIVPEATSCRSHSMTQSSPILEALNQQGITHDCNHFIPHESKMILHPWELWNGLIKCPYHWEDDVEFLKKEPTIESTLNIPGLKIYDFHPIHVFLNTESPDRYENTRDVHRIHDELIKQRNQSTGTRTLLEILLETCQ